MKIEEKKYVIHRVVFVPSEGLSARALSLAKDISNLGKVYFKVDDRNFFTHSTVYRAEYPTRNEKEVFELVNGFSTKQRPIKLIFKKFFNEWEWIGLDFKKTSDVYGAHKEIIKLLNPLREGYISEKYMEDIKTNKCNKAQKENILRYGYPPVMSEYHPHLTLARFIDEKIGDKVRDECYKKKISIPNSFIREIALVESGEHGTVTKFIKRFKLRG